MSLFSSRRHIFRNIFRVSLLVLVLAGAGLVAVRLRTPTPARAAALDHPGPCANLSYTLTTDTSNWPVSNSFPGAKFMRIDMPWAPVGNGWWWAGLDGTPQAAPIVTPVWNPTASSVGVYDNHPIGVMYYSSHWYILNEDGAPMPNGAAFNVETNVPACVGNEIDYGHVVTAPSTSMNDVYIDQSNLNDNPGAMVHVTSDWNSQGSSAGVSDPHPIGAEYNTLLGRWYIFNTDGTPIPAGASFNIGPLAGRDDHPYTVQTTPENTAGDYVVIDNPPFLPDESYHRYFVSPYVVYNPEIGGSHGVVDNHTIGIFWNAAAQHWCIFNEDLAPMPLGATFFLAFLD